MCQTMQCDGRCAKPKVHYTMSYRTLDARFEALEERLQRIELMVSLLVQQVIPEYAADVVHTEQ